MPRRLRSLHRALVVGAALAMLAAPREAFAQRSATSDPRVHPELIDSTWGPRMAVAWRLAWASRWRESEAAFAALQREQPTAMEPFVGLAFVARGEMRLAAARNWYREALTREPDNAHVREQVQALAWVRTGSAEVLGGRTTARSGGSNVVSVSVVAPLASTATLLARAGSFAGGDAISVTGSGRVDSGTVDVVGMGFVLHPTDYLWLTPRVERWSAADRDITYAWLEGAARVSQRVTLLASARAAAGADRVPQFGVGAEFVITQTGDVFTVQGLHGLREDAREIRNQFRVFVTGAPTRRVQVRLGGVAERGAVISATTLAAGGTVLVAPQLGLRAELSRRTGFAAQQTTSMGLVARW